MRFKPHLLLILLFVYSTPFATGLHGLNLPSNSSLEWYSSFNELLFSAASPSDPFYLESKLLSQSNDLTFSVGSNSATVQPGAYNYHGDLTRLPNSDRAEKECLHFGKLQDHRDSWAKDVRSDFKFPAKDKQEESGENSHVKVIGQVANELIVRFTTYKLASLHKEALKESMKVAGWQWVDRVNPASAFPTDFALLRIEECAQEEVQEKLKRLTFVKDFFPQSRLSRAILVDEGEDDLGLDKKTTVDGGLPASGEGRRMHDQMEGDKKQGKRFTTFSREEDNWRPFWENASLINEGRRLLFQRSQITSAFGAERLWAKGYTGAKVKMAVFDTGVRADHPHFRNIKERTNWTNEDTLNDNLGHGTFVAGVIASQDPQCLGFAPDTEIYAFRVFTDAQVSYTSWFLDAFNYAIATKINVLNLSIGGPDYLDRPFVEKVWEMTGNNVIMVSAIGNDGPLYGTLNNPADQSDVIGVGGIDYNDHIASFSSRGMSTWEIPHGYGRVKPDIVAYGRDIIGSKISTGCKSLSGTSVASPVVAGAVCLLASVVPEDNRWDILNPASMKQALIEGAARLNGPNIFEQGAGRLDLLESHEILINYVPRASIVPESLDFIDCPYFWPFCQQPLYAGAMPVIFNATILNGMGVVGYIEDSPQWHPLDEYGYLLDLRITFPDVIWPWTGFLGLHMQIRDEGGSFEGVIEGNVTFTVVSPPGKGELKRRRSKCVLPVRVKVIPTPPRKRRILWDQFHNVRYPPGYVPRDSLDVRNDILDWHGDHPHTNFHGMFDMLRDAGYFLETLGSPLTCFDAKQYGTLLMVDLEDEYHKEEIEKIEHDVKTQGLGLIVFADWYHVETMVKMRFFDDNTRSWWTPVTGGANIPALNDLLHPFGIAFGDMILNGPYSIGGDRGFYASGTNIAQFPSAGFVHRLVFQDQARGSTGSSILQTSVHSQVEAAVLGAVDVGNGRIAVFGDSNCLDSSHIVINCYSLLKQLLEFTSQNLRDPIIFPPARQIKFPLIENDGRLPSRRDDINFSMYSLVLDHELQCKRDARFEVQNSKGYVLKHSDPTSMQHQPMGNDAHDHRILSSLPSTLNLSTINVPETTKAVFGNNFRLNPMPVDRDDWFVASHDASTKVVTSSEDKNVHDWKIVERMSLKTRGNEKMGLGLAAIGWLNHDELDLQTLFTVQWLIPVVLCAMGFILVLSLWRMRQKRRRRARKGSARSLLIL